MIELDNKEVIDAINRVASTEDGKIALWHLKRLCDWDRTIVASENPNVTQFHAAQRGVYGSIRKTIEPKYLIQIEFNYKQKDTNDSRAPSKSRRSTASRASDTAN